MLQHTRAPPPSALGFATPQRAVLQAASSLPRLHARPALFQGHPANSQGRPARWPWELCTTAVEQQGGARPVSGGKVARVMASTKGQCGIAALGKIPLMLALGLFLLLGAPAHPGAPVLLGVSPVSAAALSPHTEVPVAARATRADPFVITEATRQAPLRTISATVGLDLAREGRVMDKSTSKAINPRDARSMKNEIAKVEAETGSEVQVLVVDSLASSPDGLRISPKSFATRLFNRWQIGPGRENNGVLVLLVLDERRVEIEIGTGLNSYMTSDWCSKLLEREAVPLFKQGRHGEGLVNVVEGLAQRLRDIDQGLVNPDDGTVECGMLIAGALVYTVTKCDPAILRACQGCNKRGGCFYDGDWELGKEATHLRPGLKQRKYRCKICGKEGVVEEKIEQYDGVRTTRDGSVYYYYDGGDSGSDGGGFSDGGGGGADY